MQIENFKLGTALNPPFSETPDSPGGGRCGSLSIFNFQFSIFNAFSRPSREVLVFALWLSAATFLSALSHPADGGDLRIGGYFKTFLTALDAADAEGESGAGEPLEGVMTNPLRLKLFWRLNPTVSGEIAYELTARVQRDWEGAGGLGISHAVSPPYRVADLRPYLYPASGRPRGSFALAQNLDRAFLTVSASSADLYLGRQSIAFGSARVVNPTDVIAPFVYEALDTEERPGVDALRVRVPAGEMGEVDAGVAFGGDFSAKAGAAFLHARFYAAEIDFSMMGMAFQENLLLGVDLARAIGGAGSWLEAAWTAAGAVGGNGAEPDYLRVSTGIDYNFSSGIYAFFEYHFNGAGKPEPRHYPGQLGDPSYTEGGVYLMGRHYVAPGLTYRATPLLSLSLQALVNVGDRSALVAPRAEYSFAEDVTIEAGAFHSLGKRARALSAGNSTSAGGAEVEPASEFGLYPGIYFTSLRIYF